MALINSEILKDIDPLQINLVTGYFKSIQQEMEDCDNPYYYPPSLVIHITILYYMIQEYFTVGGTGITISDNGDTVFLDGDGYIPRSIYGNILINARLNRMYIWKFQIVTLPSNGNPICSFGIESSNKQQINTYFYCAALAKRYNYMYYAYDTNELKGSKYSHDTKRTDYGVGAKTGDVITMILNTKLRTIKFYLNDRDLGIAYENVTFGFDDGKGYHMAVYIDEAPTCVKLIDFCQKCP